jgi:hypothetical protein
MKKSIRAISSAAIVACLLVQGCSKNDSSAPKGGTTGTTADKTASDGPVELKAKWVAGKRYLEQMTMNQKMTMNLPGGNKPMETDTEIEMGFSFSTLKQRPDGGAEIEMKFLSEKMSTKMAGQELASFDSTTDPSRDGANPMAPTMRKMIGAHVKFLTDANGNIDQVEGYDDFVKQITSGAPPQSQMMVKNMFNEDSLKQFGPHSQGLPGKPVKVGDTWPVKLDVGAGPLGKMDMSMDYKFDGWEEHDGHHCAVLSHTGKISSQGGTSTSGVNMSIDSGKTTGKSWFDPELGTLVDTSADQTMNLKMKVQGKDMTSKMDQTVSMKLVKVEDIRN